MQKKIGKRTWSGRIRKDSRGRAQCQVRCECGNLSWVQPNDLAKGKATACMSCSRQKRGGMHIDPIRRATYISYSDMRARCTRKSHPSYKTYGAAGVKICIRWLRGFDFFLEDMGWKPSLKHTIERIDNKKGYNSSNCTWALRSEQSRNTSQNLWVTYKGEELVAADMAAKYGITRRCFYDRLKRGWSVKEAVETPVQQKNLTKKFLYEKDKK